MTRVLTWSQPAVAARLPGGAAARGGLALADDAAPASDEELVTRLRAGDARALRELMERYRRPLFGYLLRLLGSVEDADDLFQETFLRVLRAADRFEPARAFRPWLYTIATNLVRNAYRSRGYRGTVSLDDGRDEACPALGDRLAARARLPHEEAAEGEQGERVRRAVEDLPERGRAALVLYYYQGLPYEEIALVLEIPLGTVKSRIHNAIARLAQVLVPGPEERVS